MNQVPVRYLILVLLWYVSVLRHYSAYYSLPVQKVNYKKVKMLLKAIATNATYIPHFEGITRLGQLGANISPDRSSLTPQVLIGNFLKHNYPLLYELQHINLLCLYLPKEDGVSPDAEYIPQIIFSIFLQ